MKTIHKITCRRDRSSSTRIGLLAAILFLALLSACSNGSPAPQPTATPLPPTETPIPTATATIEPTFTPSPTPVVYMANVVESYGQGARLTLDQIPSIAVDENDVLIQEQVNEFAAVCQAYVDAHPEKQYGRMAIGPLTQVPQESTGEPYQEFRQVDIMDGDPGSVQIAIAKSGVDSVLHCFAYNVGEDHRIVLVRSFYYPDIYSGWSVESQQYLTSLDQIYGYDNPARATVRLYFGDPDTVPEDSPWKRVIGSVGASAITSGSIDEVLLGASYDKTNVLTTVIFQ